MLKIEFKNQEIFKYNINVELNESTYGVYSNYKWIVRDFLLTCAGILYSDKCYYNEERIYDNVNYFKKRILIDFNKDYINTLDSNNIKQNIRRKFNLDFDESIFKEAVKETNVRNEVLVKDGYSFTDYGKKLSNYCFLMGLSTETLFVLNSNFKCEEKLYEQMFTNIINKFHNVFIENYDYKFLMKCKKIIVLTDFYDLVVIDPKNDTILKTDDNIKLQNKLFRYGNLVYTLNTYSKEELKQIKKSQKYEIISFEEMMTQIESINKI